MKRGGSSLERIVAENTLVVSVKVVVNAVVAVLVEIESNTSNSVMLLLCFSRSLGQSSFSLLGGYGTIVRRLEKEDFKRLIRQATMKPMRTI